LKFNDISNNLRIRKAFEQAKEMEEEQKGYSKEQVIQAITNFYMNDMLLTPSNLTKVINNLKQQEQ
jgi:hypothetical protein